MPSPASLYRSFEEDLRELEQLDDPTLALGFLRPLYDHRGERDEALLADPTVKEHVLARAEAAGGDPALAALIFEAPRELRRALRRAARLLLGRRPSRRSGRRSSRGSPRRSPRPAAASRATVSTPT